MPMWVEPDVSDLAAKMRQAFTDVHARERQARRAQRWIKTHLTWDRAADMAAARINALMDGTV